MLALIAKQYLRACARDLSLMYKQS